LHIVLLDIEYFDFKILAWQDVPMTTPGSATKLDTQNTAQLAVPSPATAVSRPAPTLEGPAGGPQSAEQKYRADVAAYVAAGGDESVQRVITAVHGLARKLDQWYTRQLADLDLSAGEWAVLSQLARSEDDQALTPTQLAEVSCVAPSSMTHRLDRMAQRDLIARAADPGNRTRVLITLTEEGWQTFKAAVRESDMVESDVLGPLSRQQREDLASLLELLIRGLDEPAR
jgi:DNA-binding MarR family transcriptional regulator